MDNYTRKSSLFLILALVVAAIIPGMVHAAPQPSGAVQVGPCHESIFGNITSIRGPHGFTMNIMDTSHSFFVDYRGAIIHDNGQTIRPGVFAGLYGCYERNETVFKAQGVTLAASPQAYAALHVPVTLRGVVDEIRADGYGVRTEHMGHIHVHTAQKGVRMGQTIVVTGIFNPLTGDLTAKTLAAA